MEISSGDEDVLNVCRWGQLKSSEGAESLRHPQHSLLHQLAVPPHKITPKLPSAPIPILFCFFSKIVYRLQAKFGLQPLLSTKNGSFQKDLVSNSKLSRFKGF